MSNAPLDRMPVAPLGWPDGTQQTCLSCRCDLPMADFKVARYLEGYSIHDSICMECKRIRRARDEMERSRAFRGLDIDAIYYKRGLLVKVKKS